ncbi:hypothetical protein BDA96_06G061100 [Sorghum bicolor]|uniref:Uncharacterized protein n=2 Tax=Sorghum bicolor TaxID=4558 RepID=A0A921UB44_SORBI|nr:hypothetical protein BDA96_06G061100 [Sorghum bicolor]OQU81416.1 hypothetical protein SORBI_3006G054266 [Sorghum bicolor]
MKEPGLSYEDVQAIKVAPCCRSQAMKRASAGRLAEYCALHQHSTAVCHLAC